MSPLEKILAEIAAERERQDERFGPQNHPDGTSDIFVPIADDARAICDAAFNDGKGTWTHILAEEVYEALAETDPVKLQVELVQIAAVCAAWVAAIRRRSRGLN